jgi:transposase InsO family protein
VECFYCGKRDHIKAECHKRIRDEANKNKSVALTTIGTSSSTIEWILDSGATSHITSDRNLLSNAQELQPTHPVGLGDGRIVYATAMGEVLLRRANGDTVTLMGVLYVPDLQYNLFSLATAMDAGAAASFDDNLCSIKIGGRTVLTATRCGGLYTLDAAATTGERALLTVNKVISDKADLWHRRYGHLSYGALSRLQREDMVEGLDATAAEFKAAGSKTCEPCIMGKQHRQPFPTSTSATIKRLELVHMDVCRPMEVPSLAGHRYFATHLDDKSGYSIVVPLATKAAVADAVIEVLEAWRVQTGEVVQRVRTDNGGEYVNKKLEHYFKKQGIVHETTTPYTPEQNGKAERLNRTLVESARAMLHDAQLPKRFWAEAIVMANYLRVRSPTASGTSTPYEDFTGDKPDISNLRVFGSIAYVHTPKEKRRKLDNKATKGIFLGYEPHSKAYRVLVNGKLVISRNVIFDESSSSRPTVATQQMYPAEAEDSRAVDTSPALESEEAQAPANTVRASSAPLESDENNDTPTLNAPQGAGCGESGATSNIGVRKSGRVKHAPDRLAFIAAQDFNDEPRDEREALARPDSELWRRAMDEEYASLMGNQTWELAELPHGKEPVDCKWVLKIKRDAQGMIERYKARLVAKGYSQQPGVDFNEVYAPVSKYATLRAFLAKVSSEDMELQVRSMDFAKRHGHGTLA